MNKIPEGSREVISVLKDTELYTLEEINAKITTLDMSTVRYAIRRLLEIGLIQSIPDLQDMRQVRYRLVSDGKLSRVIGELPVEVVKQIEDVL